MNDAGEILVLIPAYNEEQTLPGVITDLRDHGFQHLVVVNDGSIDQTAQITQQTKTTLISHRLNRGLGAALGTGLAYARKIKAKAVLTFDADGQHRVADAPKVVQPILEEKADVVIGIRQHQIGVTPLSRLLGNWLLNILTFLFFGIYTRDSQSGLRAFSRQAIDKIELRSNRMEVSSEIFQQIKKHHLKLVEVPVKSIYTEYSLKKGQEGLGVLNAIRIVSRLILRSVGH